MRPDPRLPVTVLSGFLGSGKTTLMNHLLATHGMFRITLGQPWGDDGRLTQAVFIGRSLRREEIVSGLESCRA